MVTLYALLIANGGTFYSGLGVSGHQLRAGPSRCLKLSYWKCGVHKDVDIKVLQNIYCKFYHKGVFHEYDIWSSNILYKILECHYIIISVYLCASRN